MGGHGDYCAKWNMPVSERQIPYDLTYMWNTVNKITYEWIETEAWIHGTDWQLSEGRRRGDWMKDGEGIGQRTYMYHP